MVVRVTVPHCYNSPLLQYEEGIAKGMSTLPFNVVLHSEKTLSSSYSPKKINPFVAFVHHLIGARIPCGSPTAQKYVIHLM